MCLYISHVPKDFKSSIIIQSVKHVELWDYGNPDSGNKSLRTPYRGVHIPTSGWLIPTVYYRKPIVPWGVISGGAIHAYESPGTLANRRFYRPYSYANYMSGKFPSYSLGVLAYSSYELASRALYLPHADESKNKKETIKVLDTALKRKDPLTYLLDSNVIPAYVKRALKFHEKNFDDLMGKLE